MTGIARALWHCPEVTSKAHPRFPQLWLISPGPRGSSRRGTPLRGHSPLGGRGRLQSEQSPGLGAAVGAAAQGSSSLPPAPSRPRRALLPPRLGLRAAPRLLQTTPATGRAESVGNRDRALTELPRELGSGPAPWAQPAASASTGHRLAETSLPFPHRPPQPALRGRHRALHLYFKQFNFKNILFSAKITFHFHARPHLQLHQARSRTRRDMQWQQGESGAGGGSGYCEAAEPQGRSASRGLQHPAASFPIPGIAGT